MVQVPIWGTEKTDVPAQTIKQSKFSLPQPFCSIQPFKGLNETHPHWEEQSVLLSLLIQMLISSRNPHRHIQK